MRRAPLFSTVLAVSLALSLAAGVGCISLEKPSPRKKLFVLDIERPGESRATTRFGVALVRPVDVAPLHAGRGIVYRKGDAEYVSDFYNQYFLQPEAMLTSALRDWLGAAGIFEEIVPSSSLLAPAWAVECVVEEMVADVRDAKAPAAAVRLRARLMDLRPGTPRVRLTREYAELVPVESVEPDALVEGLGEAFRAAFDRLEADMAQVEASEAETR